MSIRVLVAALLVLGFACSPGTRTLRIEMRSKADRARLIRGWSGFEQQGGSGRLRFCWVEGTSARIDVGRPGVKGVARFRIRAWPFAHPALPAQTVQLWANSIYIGTQVMSTEPSEYEWVFPAALFQRSGNDVYLLFGRANRPSEILPGNNDTRALAAAVEFVDFRVDG